MGSTLEIDRAREVLDEGLGVVARRSGGLVECGDSFADVLMGLMGLVLEGNEAVNLTAIVEPEEFVRLHLLDSLAVVGVPEFEGAESVIDVGSGAGFPGLPLAALYPGKRFLLMDSLRKRVEFIDYAVSCLGLGNVETLHGRAETAGQDLRLREQFDVALCRAVGKLPVVLEYSLPFVRVGGAAVFYKTVPAAGEIKDSLLARKLLGGAAEVRTETYVDILPGRNHALYIVEKTHPTPRTYPRREGVPSKVPIAN
jgi:16S rRNA (guanine527-N7)-methyltransferase